MKRKYISSVDDKLLDLPGLFIYLHNRLKDIARELLTGVSVDI